jgi:hypothetical protein
MSDPEPVPHGHHEIVAEHELIQLAGFDLDHYRSLSEVQQRLVLKMAEHLVNAERRAESSE